MYRIHGISWLKDCRSMNASPLKSYYDCSASHTESLRFALCGLFFVLQSTICCDRSADMNVRHMPSLNQHRIAKIHTKSISTFSRAPEHSGGELRAEEATGLVTLRVRSGRYTVVALIQVPDGYPMEGCGVELKSHNFPQHIARRHLVQVKLFPLLCVPILDCKLGYTMWCHQSGHFVMLC